MCRAKNCVGTTFHSIQVKVLSKNPLYDLEKDLENLKLDGSLKKSISDCLSGKTSHNIQEDCESHRTETFESNIYTSTEEYDSSFDQKVIESRKEDFVSKSKDLSQTKTITDHSAEVNVLSSRSYSDEDYTEEGNYKENVFQLTPQNSEEEEIFASCNKNYFSKIPKDNIVYFKTKTIQDLDFQGKAGSTNYKYETSEEIDKKQENQIIHMSSFVQETVSEMKEQTRIDFASDTFIESFEETVDKNFKHEEYTQKMKTCFYDEMSKSDQHKLDGAKAGDDERMKSRWKVSFKEDENDVFGCKVGHEYINDQLNSFYEESSLSDWKRIVDEDKRFGHEEFHDSISTHVLESIYDDDFFGTETAFDEAKSCHKNTIGNRLGIQKDEILYEPRIDIKRSYKSNSELVEIDHCQVEKRNVKSYSEDFIIDDSNEDSIQMEKTTEFVESLVDDVVTLSTAVQGW